MHDAVEEVLACFNRGEITNDDIRMICKDPMGDQVVGIFAAMYPELALSLCLSGWAHLNQGNMVKTYEHATSKHRREAFPTLVEIARECWKELGGLEQ